LLVLVWELDCSSVHSFLIPYWTLFLQFLLLLGGSCASDDCQRRQSSLASG